MAATGLPGGTEVDIAGLCADVRWSTTMGEANADSDLVAPFNQFDGVTTRELLRRKDVG
ncbi:hypothetical protein [Mycobacterium lepromatosis]|uniref:hypothetical protein n=1 Tax=Mycobacterium lepromatosis TaxID=480418 RepID=UPI0012E03721|nr:hypothetical protein [Mycobacterium lepromatosis]